MASVPANFLVRDMLETIMASSSASSPSWPLPGDSKEATTVTQTLWASLAESPLVTSVVQDVGKSVAQRVGERVSEWSGGRLRPAEVQSVLYDVSQRIYNNWLAAQLPDDVKQPLPERKE